MPTREHQIEMLNRECVGAHCCIVRMGYEHTDHVVRWRNDPQNSVWFKTNSVFTKAGHESWLSAQLGKGTDFNWVILDLEKKPVGALGIYNVDWGLKRAEFGRFVVDGAARGRGIGHDAMNLVLSLAKSSGLSEIYLIVKASNRNAIRLYEKLGFKLTQSDESFDVMSLYC